MMILELCIWIINISYQLHTYSFECLFHRTPDFDFLCTFGCMFFFPFLSPYHAHKLDLCSSPCEFLEYSSSHLGTHCLDLASQHIYVSSHVCFHKGVFSFVKSKQIAQPTLIASQAFHPVDSLITISNSSSALPAPHKWPCRSPTLSATIPLSPNPTLLSPSLCFSNDHYIGISSPSSKSHLDRSVTTANTDFAASSPTSIVASSGPLTDSFTSLQLFIDLSSYPF